MFTRGRCDDAKATGFPACIVVVVLLGKDNGLFAKANGSGPIALAGDHFLYHLKAAPVRSAKLRRFPLPKTLK